MTGPERRDPSAVVAIRSFQDIVTARQRGREIAEAIDFSSDDVTRILTAISELARNIVQYARTGEIEIISIPGPTPGVEIVARDEGPGIEDMTQALLDTVSSSGGLGIGLPGTRRLMDEFDIQSARGAGTVVTIRKWRR